MHTTHAIEIAHGLASTQRTIVGAILAIGRSVDPATAQALAALHDQALITAALIAAQQVKRPV